VHKGEEGEILQELITEVKGTEGDLQWRGVGESLQESI
jgi:hypothetical protein